MKLIHPTPEAFSQMVRQSLFVLDRRAEIAENEIVLITGPEDYPRYAFHVVLAARFRAWAPLRSSDGRKDAFWAFLPNAWWVLARPFLMQDVAMAGRRYHAGEVIVDVHEADEVIIRQRKIEETGPLHNPGPHEPPLRTIDEGRIAELFHALWGRDTSHPKYNKAEWGELQTLLRERGVRF